MMVEMASTDSCIRRGALELYQILDTPPEDAFDRIVRLVASHFGSEYSSISFLDYDRIWFKAKQGFCTAAIIARDSFCRDVVQSVQPVVVLDATRDERFKDSGLVTGMGVRFYAGYPLVTPAGIVVGSVCAFSQTPRTRFETSEMAALADFSAIVMDLMELRRVKLAERGLRWNIDNLSAVLGDGVLCVDTSGRINFWNAAAENIFGYRSEEIIGKPVELLVGDSPSPFNLETMPVADLVRTGGVQSEFVGRCKSGRLICVEASISAWRDPDGLHVASVFRDISARRRDEDRIRYLAEHDDLTGLINRGAMERLIDEGAAWPADETRRKVLITLDLDGFKEVNDTLGHACGDQLLVAVVNRLRNVVGPAVVMARVGGDGFAALVDEGSVADRARNIAERMLGVISEHPFVFDRQAVYVRASAGLACFPQHGRSGNELLANADLALHRAKKSGRQRISYYEPEIRAQIARRRTLHVELQRAMEQSEFVLYYQPQVSLQDLTIVGAEALVRWNHPERGLVLPGEFISVLNASPLASQFSRWVMETACRQAREWHDLGYPIRVGVNVSQGEFRAGLLRDSIESVLVEAKLPACLIEIEVTEDVVLDHGDETVSMLHSLREQGVSIAFDDFGTGYASLVYLKRFPLDRLKVDRSFVGEIGLDREDEAIVRSIIDLGRHLNLEIIAEGVETSAQAEFLRGLGCRQAQGFHFGGAVPAAEFEALVVTQATTTDQRRTSLGNPFPGRRHNVDHKS